MYKSQHEEDGKSSNNTREDNPGIPPMMIACREESGVCMVFNTLADRDNTHKDEEEEVKENTD